MQGQDLGWVGLGLLEACRICDLTLFFPLFVRFSGCTCICTVVLFWTELNEISGTYESTNENKITMMELKTTHLATLLLSLSSLLSTVAALDCFSHNGTTPPPSLTTIHPNHQNTDEQPQESTQTPPNFTTPPATDP